MTLAAVSALLNVRCTPLTPLPFDGGLKRAHHRRSMSTERSPEVRSRARLHHALGNPGRLAIVEALLIGDMSPAALADALAMSTSLLAHHLKALANAEVIRRTSSEGDRRHAYVTLKPGVFDGLTPTVRLTASRIVFVCTQNGARSQLAAALWAARSTIPAVSAGTYPAPAVHSGAVAAAQRQHVAFTPGVPCRLDEVLHTGDVVITVCDRAHEELKDGLAHTHWSVKDPSRSGGDTSFDTALRELSVRVARLAPTVHHT